LKFGFYEIENGDVEEIKNMIGIGIWYKAH